MTERIELKYINEKLQIGVAGIKEVYSLSDSPQLLIPEVYKGKLVYRAKCSTKRISYDQIKKGLIRKRPYIEQEVPDWLCCHCKRKPLFCANLVRTHEKQRKKKGFQFIESL